MLYEVITNAVNQVLSRTIVTSLTVVLVLIPLTFAGGEVLHDFSLALLWGVIFGTYSSVFVASPLLLLWPVITSYSIHYTKLYDITAVAERAKQQLGADLNAIDRIRNNFV